VGVDAKHGRLVSSPPSSDRRRVAIVGAGPAGLFAAERTAREGHRVTVYERMASPARKFLLAGRGGLNLTHNEALAAFLDRYGDEAQDVRAAVEAFPPEELVAWANGLGAATFVGTSGRVFPRAMKASPLLRAWLRRLAELGVTIETRHLWTGFAASGALQFETSDNSNIEVAADAALLALGGASWPRLGSDGRWASLFEKEGIEVTPLMPANCGVLIQWSDVFRSRFEGSALKRIALTIDGVTRRGEAVVTRDGLEGGAVYALGPQIRRALVRDGAATLLVDLKPEMLLDDLASRLAKPRRGDTMTNFVRKATHLDAASIGLLRESELPAEAELLAAKIKGVPLRIMGLASIDRAISTAGGVEWRSLDKNLMLKNRPGVFLAGEMLDWEAPTGGYLLQATFATAARAAVGLLDWLGALPLERQPEG
jgi:uncharacterized flavoprotein (TIGR03862 family)